MNQRPFWCEAIFDGDTVCKSTPIDFIERFNGREHLRL
jgi:hypothetical protein